MHALKAVPHLRECGAVYRRGGLAAGCLVGDCVESPARPRRSLPGCGGSPTEVFAYIECHYNRERRRPAIGAPEEFGRDTVKCGIFPTAGHWKTRFGRRSPRYTTRWPEILTVGT